MSKNSVVTVKSKQTIDGATEEACVTVTSEYEVCNNLRVLKYEEAYQDGTAPDKVTLTVKGENLVRVSKSGNIKYCMEFSTLVKSVSCAYNTPYGTMTLDVHTKQIYIAKENQCDILRIEYSLYIGGTYLSDNEIEFTIMNN